MLIVKDVLMGANLYLRNRQYIEGFAKPIKTSGISSRNGQKRK
jgi:hypothetical protein